MGDWILNVQFDRIGADFIDRWSTNLDQDFGEKSRIEKRTS